MEMNKILLDGELLSLDNLNELNIKTNSKLLIFNCDKDIKLNINMSDSSELIILDCCMNSISKDINVYQNNNSKVKYIHSFKISGIYNFNYVANINGNNNCNDIILRGITSGVVNISADAVAMKNTKNNTLNEDIKVLNMGGKVFSSPMLHVSCMDVIANHNTAISNIREDQLFYLNSKGISDIKAIKLIEDSYLYGIFKDEEEFYNLIK